MSTYCLTSAGFVAVIKEVKLLLGPGLCENSAEIPPEKIFSNGLKEVFFKHPKFKKARSPALFPKKQYDPYIGMDGESISPQKKQKPNSGLQIPLHRLALNKSQVSTRRSRNSCIPRIRKKAEKNPALTFSPQRSFPPRKLHFIVVSIGIASVAIAVSVSITVPIALINMQVIEDSIHFGDTTLFYEVV